MVAYGLFRLVPRAYIGWTTVVYSLSVTAAFHIKRMYENYGGWDMTIAHILMMQTVHLSYLAWDYTDGADHENKSLKKLGELPTFFEFLAAALCPSQILAGPASHFVDFKNYIYQTNEYSKPVGTVWPAFKKFLTGFTWLVIYGSIVNYFPFDLFYTEQFYNSSFFARTFYFMVIGLGVKSRYYVVFKLAEGSVTLSGQSFNGLDPKTGEPKHDRLCMINIYCTEISVFLRSIIEEWHIPVQYWLKHCIHMRLKGSSQVKIFLTFFVSAAWHGFYPLYFGSFLFYSVGTVNFNYIYKMFVIHKFLRQPLLYVAQSYYTHILQPSYSIFMNLSANYFTVLFAMLLTERIIAFSRGLIWIPIVHAILFVIVLIVDKKDTKVKLNYKKYSRMKIYECFKSDAELMAQCIVLQLSHSQLMHYALNHVQ
eukprot:TRINITY_DN106150_c0_g1_i1.p2 TRINITY_DN106150_c0_g1~~TRINITY_DN106150_c0_g1_i1.p2  ORF type:complete len:424 (+),score=9.45 TRINITY_DN106150_c0_g1_i1:466-1737(+)